MRAIESGSFSRSTSVPRSPSVSARLPRRHHDLLELPRVAHAAFDAQQRVLHRVAEQAHRLVGIGLAQRGGDLGRRHAIGAQAQRVQVDAHLAHRQAADLDTGHAFDALQPLAHQLVAQDRQLAPAACGALAAPGHSASAMLTTGSLLSLFQRAMVGAGPRAESRPAPQRCDRAPPAWRGPCRRRARTPRSSAPALRRCAR
jgi:hypothetical protein